MRIDFPTADSAGRDTPEDPRTAVQRDCLILGSGRSGTSLTAGLLANSGYFMGDAIYEVGITQGNPKGQFEDPEINGINEDILGPPLRAYRHSRFNKLFHPQRRRDIRVRYFQRWLAAIPKSVRISAPAEVLNRIKAVTARQPFCFKDPRFSYTLPVWRPYIGNAVLICVFRHPAITAASIVTECKRAKYLHDLPMDTKRALRVWRQMYRHILEIHHPAGGDWMFVHYDQIRDGSARELISARLNAPIDTSFADPTLRRSRPAGTVSKRVMAIYRRLCELASYREVN
jgi:hypothetical protein